MDTSGEAEEHFLRAEQYFRSHQYAQAAEGADPADSCRVLELG